ncbi:F-box protein [Tripterygium wilfordii]|uniref:F-box protein n=1 Tax=Tripterygium wilfordii TaxID=458696 RepID=A0A7J7CRI9_TRIWF|nr:F-box protein [Tripterygium wilfordii]
MNQLLLENNVVPTIKDIHQPYLVSRMYPSIPKRRNRRYSTTTTKSKIHSSITRLACSISTPTKLPTRTGMIWNCIAWDNGVDEGEVHVDDVSMEIRDIEGRRFDGRESLVILQEALVKGERKRSKIGEREKNCKEFESRRIKKKPIRDSVVYKFCYAAMIFTAFCVTVPLSMALSIASIIILMRDSGIYTKTYFPEIKSLRK